MLWVLMFGSVLCLTFWACAFVPLSTQGLRGRWVNVLTGLSAICPIVVWVLGILQDSVVCSMHGMHCFCWDAVQEGWHFVGGDAGGLARRFAAYTGVELHAATLQL